MTPSRRGLARLLRLALKHEQQPTLSSHRASYANATGTPPGPATPPPPASGGGPAPPPPKASTQAPPRVPPGTATGPAASAKQQAAPAGGSKPAGPSSSSTAERKAGGVDIFTVIPVVGLPVLGLFYAYQSEHDARIAAVHDSIKAAREQSGGIKPPASPAALKQAAIESANSKQPPSQPPAPAPPAGAPAPPTPPPAAPAPSAALAVPFTPPAASTSPSTPASAAPTASTPPIAPETTAPVATTAATDRSAPSVTIQAAADQVLGAIATAGQEDTTATPITSTTSAPDHSPLQSTAAVEAPAAVPTPPVASTTEAVPLYHAPSPAALAHASRAGYTPVLTTPHEEEVAPIKKGAMGVNLDLTPSGLIQFAIERGAGPGEDWSGFAARHKQAVSDAELLARAAQQINAWHDAEVAGLKKEADDHAKRAEEILKMAKANAESFKKLLRQHQEMAAELRQMEVVQAEKRTTLSANKAQESERVERTQILDQLRLEVGALASAHEARTSQQAASLLSHSLTLSILALDAALDSGKPLKQHLQALIKTAAAAEANAPPSAAAAGLADASLIKASAESIPDDAASRGIPTREELGNSLRGMKNAATALAMLPEPSADHGSGGILSHAAAKLFAYLKSDETGVVQALGPDQAVSKGGFPSALAAAELYLAQGRLAEAAHVLSHGAKGTAAAAGVAGWVADVEARAKADQALKLLRAHAGLLAVAVS